MARVISRGTSKALTVPVSGIVLDAETGEPLIGAHVAQRIPGEVYGAATGLDGSYAFQAVPGEVIEVSFVGYVKETFTTEEPSSGNVHLMERASYGLPEVEIFGDAPEEEETGSGWLLGLLGLGVAVALASRSRRRRPRARR